MEGIGILDLENSGIAGVTDIDSVKYAVLETTGRISVITKRKEQPPNATDLGVQVEENGLPVIIVSDGRVLSQNLKVRNLSHQWLKQQLAGRKIQDISQVFLMTVDEAGKVYLSVKENNQ
jgi:uncharacterized membrane protein YcaP (DUF421 family)